MKILMIGAHQDDNEICCGGLAYKYVKLGYEVRFLSLCNGCGGHHILSPKEITARRAKESAAVAEFLGIKYDVWDIDDCNLVADLPTRKRLIRYIREFNPDMIISHRPNDYHADHRAAGQLVQDASYLLIVPNECPDVPAMRFMPVIVYNEDPFANPKFRCDIAVNIDDVIEDKLRMIALSESQVYEWLPYTEGRVAPENKEERFEWFKGMKITSETTDEDVINGPIGYAVDCAKVAARFRKELIEKYGEEVGSKVRYAEAFEICEYGAQMDENLKQQLFPF